MFRSFVVNDQAFIAHRSFTAIAEILQIFRSMNAAVERLMDCNRFSIGLQHDHLMFFEATHRAVSIIATGTQEIGTIIATRDRLLLALARGAHESADVNGGKI